LSPDFFLAGFLATARDKSRYAASVIVHDCHELVTSLKRAGEEAPPGKPEFVNDAPHQRGKDPTSK